MADKILFNYAALEDMAKQCELVSGRLVELGNTANKTGQQMQGGALVGPAGDAFVLALGTFTTKVGRLAEKFADEAKEIRQAVTDMQQADTTAANDF